MSKLRIYLIGSDTNRLEQIDVLLSAKLGDVDNPLETMIFQTVREYDGIAGQASFRPDAVLVDSMIVSREGKTGETEIGSIIHNLKDVLGYRGPIIACSWGLHQNRALMNFGATHSVDRNRPSDITLNLIANEVAAILREKGIGSLRNAI